MDKIIGTSGSSGNFFLAGCLLLAGIDMNGMLDYGLKAVLGGSIWLGFKLVEERLLKKKEGRGDGAVSTSPSAFPYRHS